MGGKRRSHGRGKTIAVDGQRRSGRDLIGVGRTHDQRAQPTHFLVQEPDGIEFVVVGAERIRADEFRERGALVGRGHAQRPHLVQHDGNAARGDLPSRLGSGESAADHVHCLKALVGHGAKVFASPEPDNPCGATAQIRPARWPRCHLAGLVQNAETNTRANRKQKRPPERALLFRNLRAGNCPMRCAECPTA